MASRVLFNDVFHIIWFEGFLEFPASDEILYLSTEVKEEKQREMIEYKMCNSFTKVNTNLSDGSNRILVLLGENC